MIIREIQQKYFEALNKIYEVGEVNAITNIVLEEVLGYNKNKIIAKANEAISIDNFKILENYLHRLLLEEPLQYVLENAWFYDMKFKVSNTVLIPRPETEELVFEAIKFLKKDNKKSVIDIGTGSGCIAISIKKNIANAIVSAIDVSQAALDIAKQNALVNETPIDFFCTDFLEENNFKIFGKYDLIISNPPYIPNTEILDNNVTNFEPHLALFVPENDVLIFYKKILAFAETHLEKTGRIMLEVHENLAKECAALFTEKNYAVEIKLDMQGKERMLICRYQKQ